MDEVEERSDGDEPRLRSEELRGGADAVEDVSELVIGGGSQPGCCTPSSQIGSGHSSGVASLSRMYRIAFPTRCPLPYLAAVSSADPLFLGDEPAVDMLWVWDIRAGSERSVDDVLNVWENQPESRVGRSPMREPVEDVEA